MAYRCFFPIIRERLPAEDSLLLYGQFILGPSSLNEGSLLGPLIPLRVPYYIGGPQKAP